MTRPRTAPCFRAVALATRCFLRKSAKLPQPPSPPAAAPPPAGADADFAYGAYQRGFYLTALQRGDQARAGRTTPPP